MNVANSYRLQEECDVLSLRLAKCKGKIDLPQFEAVMLASLRSLVPKDWNSSYEVAWNWLWENVERMLRSLLGRPTVMEQNLTRFLSSIDEATQVKIRHMIYAAFFEMAPTGQDFFKQSTTRLHSSPAEYVRDTIKILGNEFRPAGGKKESPSEAKRVEQARLVCKRAHCLPLSSSRRLFFVSVAGMTKTLWGHMARRATAQLCSRLRSMCLSVDTQLRLHPRTCVFCSKAIFVIPRS